MKNSLLTSAATRATASLLNAGSCSCSCSYSHLLAFAFALVLGLLPFQLFAQAPGIYREIFNGLDRANSSLWQLTNDTRFLNNTPSSAGILTSFRTELNRDDDYGQRL